MQRSELHIFLVLLIVCWQFFGCSSNNDTQSEYNVQVTFDTDSTVVTDNLCIFVDNHQYIAVDTITLDSNRTATFASHTDDTDELYLMSGNGIELCHFYATAKGRIEVNISGKADSLVIDYTSPSDTINSWLQRLESITDSTLSTKEIAIRSLDSLKECGENKLRTTLLLRDFMPYLGDSIYVRRYLGGISDKDKPEWLVKCIDHQYPQLRSVSDLGRLSAAQFQMHDTLVNINTSSRSDYMLLYFWGDYSQSSIDSLKTLSKRVDKDYSDKRIVFVSFCVSAPDSTWWKDHIKGLPVGHHALINGGLADPRISNWHIDQIPYNLVTDMFTNIQNRNCWNDDLMKALNRIPRRSNYINNSKSSTTKLKKK